MFSIQKTCQPRITGTAKLQRMRAREGKRTAHVPTAQWILDQPAWMKRHNNQVWKQLGLDTTQTEKRYILHMRFDTRLVAVL